MSLQEGAATRKQPKATASLWAATDGLNNLHKALTDTMKLLRQLIDYAIYSTSSYAAVRKTRWGGDGGIVLGHIAVLQVKVKCPWCRGDDQVHFYSVSVMQSNQQKDAVCPTHKETVSSALVGLGNAE
jgi:hypothetical protein